MHLSVQNPGTIGSIQPLPMNHHHPLPLLGDPDLGEPALSFNPGLYGVCVCVCLPLKLSLDVLCWWPPLGLCRCKPHGADRVSRSLLPKAVWGSPPAIFCSLSCILACVSSSCFCNVPRVGFGGGGRWSLIIHCRSADGKLELWLSFPSPLSCDFKGFFASNGNSFQRCGQNLGVDMLFLSPECPSGRRRAAQAATGLCSQPGLGVSEDQSKCCEQGRPPFTCLGTEPQWGDLGSTGGWGMRPGGPGRPGAQEMDAASGLDPLGSHPPQLGTQCWEGRRGSLRETKGMRGQEGASKAPKTGDKPNKMVWTFASSIHSLICLFNKYALSTC